MAKAAPKIVLSPSRDIPFDKLTLSQSNVRRVKAGVSIDELADDIARRTLLQSLNVRPVLDENGRETEMFEVPAGGRRYRALELLVKQKRLAKNALVPCVVRQSSNEAVSAEEDSLAENTHREQLHPLDQFRGMQRLVERGEDVEAIAAHFMTTPAVVRQRLKLASVSAKLHEVYAADGMTLEQLMAFTVCDDHARQEQVWELLAHSWNKQPAFIRQKLTENTVRGSDKRALFVGVDAYVAAGGAITRDLFEPDDGGWLQHAALLDRLVDEKLKAEGERIGAEGWKWIAVAVDFPYGVTDGLRELEGVAAPISEEERATIDAVHAEDEALQAEWADASEVPEPVEQRMAEIAGALETLLDRPLLFDPLEVARAGAFVSLDVDGALYVERGYVRPEDEPEGETDDEALALPESGGAAGFGGDDQVQRTVITIGGAAPERDDVGAGENDEDLLKPLPDRLLCELTAARTIALQDAFACSPSVAFAAVLHSMVLSIFYLASRESCLGMAITKVSFGFQAPGTKDSAPALAIAERHARWKARLPGSDKDLWDALQKLDAAEQASLFAHCAAFAVNALWEPVPRYDNGRISAHTIERRLEHSHVLARAVGLDMLAAGWKPTVDNYLGRVTKPRILEAVAQGRDLQTAGLIDHLKKADMAREAERLLQDADWLPEPLRTPSLDSLDPAVDAGGDPSDVADGERLPAFLEADSEADAADEGEAETAAVAIAAE